MLAVYGDFASGRIEEATLRNLLDITKNFVMRRFVCGVPTHGLNKIFVPLYGRQRQGELSQRRRAS